MAAAVRFVYIAALPKRMPPALARTAPSSAPCHSARDTRRPEYSAPSSAIDARSRSGFSGALSGGLPDVMSCLHWRVDFYNRAAVTSVNTQSLPSRMPAQAGCTAPATACKQAVYGAPCSARISAPRASRVCSHGTYNVSRHRGTAHLRDGRRNCASSPSLSSSSTRAAPPAPKAKASSTSTSGCGDGRG